MKGREGVPGGRGDGRGQSDRFPRCRWRMTPPLLAGPEMKEEPRLQVQAKIFMRLLKIADNFTICHPPRRTFDHVPTPEVDDLPLTVSARDVFAYHVICRQMNMKYFAIVTFQ